MIKLTRSDHLIGSVDALLKALTVPPKETQISPADTLSDDILTATESELSGNLMRVNHAGEIAAQGLYLGQALTARSENLYRHFISASEEEKNHLAWCSKRLHELHTRPSVLTPFWLLGSFALGAAVGCCGDANSLGFVEETERQVQAHLQTHLDTISHSDHKSRAIIEQMQADEAQHAEQAHQKGARELPFFVPIVMQAGAQVLKKLAFRI